MVFSNFLCRISDDDFKNNYSILIWLSNTRSHISSHPFAWIKDNINTSRSPQTKLANPEIAKKYY